MSHPTDIVAYTFQADILCPACTASAVGFTGDRDTEAVLRAVAELSGVDREDEHSFDSDDFPKVVFADFLNDETWEHCGECGDCLHHDLADYDR